MLLFGQRNPRPVPILDVTDPGATSTVLAPEADLRTDLPRYRVWRDGVLVDSPVDVVDVWDDDLVAFLIGCSFSFELALLDAGVPVRNLEQNRNVSIYEMPEVHGAPVHEGSPSALGIADLSTPDFGDPVVAHDGDVPVFGACGVTPQAALMASRPPLAITHAPGHMFVTDVHDRAFRQP